MNANASTAPKTFAAFDRVWSALVSLPRDGSFRFSLKFGIAGVLAVYGALLNKNHQPTWALFTVFVLMVAQYIGAIEEKSLLRMIGTIVGGFFGYLITASLQQDVFLYLGLLGLFVAFTTAMFGQARFPYAFLLCGMTAVVCLQQWIGATPEFLDVHDLADSRGWHWHRLCAARAEPLVAPLCS
jgi:uncharacterized membrane protein YccC